MKVLLLLALASLLSAATSGFVIWKAADLKNFASKLHSKINQDHTANERLPDYEGHAVFVVHREGTGLAEIHETLAHMIYVISGEAVVVVGGTMSYPKNIAPEQTVGTSVEGGEATRLAAGDLVHIPPKTPHWFKVASGAQITYVMMNLESGGP
jgi:mannose-6-phosphate isomerase-like protein (cupin superfamily)